MLSLTRNTPAPAVPKPLISLKEMTTGPKVQDDTAVQDRAQRYDYALGETVTPGVQRIAESIKANNEQYLREEAARRNDFKLQQEYTNQVSELARMGDTETLNSIIGSPPGRTNPNTVLEEDFATRLLAETYFNDPEGPQTYEQLTPQRQRLYDQTYDAYHDIVARDEIIRRKYEQYSDQWYSQSFLHNARDFIETLIPLKDWSNFETILRDTPADPGLHLQGNTMLNQVMYLHSLPIDEFEARFAEAVDTLAAVNMNNAFQFIQAVQSYGRTSQGMDNLFNAMDIAGIAIGVGKLGLRAAAGARNVARGARVTADSVVDDVVREGTETFDGVDNLSNNFDATREANRTGESPSAHIAARGNIGEAVVTEMVDEPISFKTPRGTTRGMVRRLMSYANPSELITGSGRTFSMARDLLARSTTRINRLYDQLMSNQMTIARLTKEQELAAVQEATDVGRKEFSRYGNVIRNVERIEAEDTGILNTDSIKFTLGKSDGSVFSSPQVAGTYATKVIRLPKGSYKIEPVSGGYGITVTRAVDETHGVRGTNVLTENKTRDARFGSVRIANELFGQSQNEARKKLVHLTARNNTLQMKMAKELKLGRGDRKQFTQFLEHMRNANILPGVNRGQVTPNTIIDFENTWRTFFGTAPSNAQKRAYYAFIRSHQIEWGLKNLAVLRGKQRKGIHQVSLQPRKGSKLTTDFDGQIIPDGQFSWDKLDPKQGILIYDSSKATHEFHTVGDLLPHVKQRMLAMANAGNQAIIRVWNRAERPFLGMGENRIVDYVFSSDYIRKPLKNEQIPFDPNGALLYDNPYQIKQLNTGHIGNRHVLFGERRVAPSDSQPEGHAMAQHFNTARNLYNNSKRAGGNLNAFNTHVTANIPHVDPKDLKKAFDDGELSTTDDFILAKNEESLLSSNHAKTARDRIGEASDLSDDTSQGVSIESSNKPMFDLNIGEVVSPVATIERNLQSAIKSGAVADYITKAAEQFAKEFGSVLKNSERELREHPINVLLSPQWVEKGLDGDKVKVGKRFQKAVRDLLGYETPLRRTLNRIEDKLYESVYNLPFGNKQIARLAMQFPSMIIEDAPVLLRSLAFNLSMGFWNPYQIWKQIQTITVTAAITNNPIHAMKGAGAGSLMMALNRSSKTPGMINNISKMSRALGWDPADFKELYDLADRSGLSIIRGEQAFRDRWLDPPVVQSGFRKVLHNSTMFFRGTEEFVRLNGLSVAYSEWRKANPNKAFRRLDQEAVLRRSDDLTANMTSASNAMYNNSKLLTFPTQFMSYQLRLMELFWGKRLTKMEKFRLFAYQSALYGLPAGLTVAGGILPLPEIIRQNLLAQGVTFDSTGAQALQGGMMGVMSFLIAGHETSAAQEFGPGGLDAFMDAMAGDATFREIIMGPSGSKLTQIVESAYPFITGLKRIFGMSPNEGNLNLGWEDVAAVLRNIATFSSIERAVYAIKTHAYLRRNGQIAMGNDPDGDGLLNDPTGTDRFMNNIEVGFLAAFGVDPAIVNDEFLLRMAMQDYDAMQEGPRAQLADVFKRQFDLALNTEMSNEDKYTQNQRLEQEAAAWAAMGGFTPDQIDGIIADVARQGGASYANMYYEFSTTHTRASPETLDTRRQNLINNQRPLPQ
jgi:hypothetical protein